MSKYCGRIAFIFCFCSFVHEAYSLLNSPLGLLIRVLGRCLKTPPTPSGSGCHPDFIYTINKMQLECNLCRFQKKHQCRGLKVLCSQCVTGAKRSVLVLGSVQFTHSSWVKAIFESVWQWCNKAAVSQRAAKQIGGNGNMGRTLRYLAA